MSNGVKRQDKSGILSYLGFNSGPRRRTSISLPVRNHASDPFEKPGRFKNNYSYSRSSPNMGSGRSGPLLQGQRGRSLRLAVAISLIIVLIYFLAPSDKTSQFSQYVGS